MCLRNQLFAFLACITVVANDSIAQDARSGKNVIVPARNARPTKTVNNNKSGHPAGSHVIHWEAIESFTSSDGRVIKRLAFEGAVYQGKDESLPTYHFQKSVPVNTGSVNVVIEPLEVATLTADEAKTIKHGEIPADFNASAVVRSSRLKRLAIVSVFPLRKNATGKIEKLVSFNLKWEYIKKPASRDGGRSNHWKASSVLASGDWYKIATFKDGIYKVDYQMLREKGIIADDIPSNLIRLFGTGGGALPIKNSGKRPDDLEEMAIWMEDGGDGVFQKGDYFLFYGEDQVTWQYSGSTYSHELNPYTDSVIYFLTTSPMQGLSLRVETKNYTNTPVDRQVTTYDYLDYHEADLTNLIHSGREWYGENFGIKNSYDFVFTVPDVVQSSDAIVKARLALRSIGDSSSARIYLPYQGASSSGNATPVSSAYAATYAVHVDLRTEFKPKGPNFLVQTTFNPGLRSSVATAWLDFITVHARRKLSYHSEAFNFRDGSNINTPGLLGEYLIESNVQNLQVWKVENPLRPVHFVLQKQGKNFAFKDSISNLNEYIVYEKGKYNVPGLLGKVPNQDLHATPSLDFVIITHPEFWDNAQDLAKFHLDTDNLESGVFTPQQIFNEFSGGAQDVTAIKEFLRMLYHRDLNAGRDPVRYLLLFGDASYDYKSEGKGNSNFVPTYQTLESLEPTQSVATDDYYGLLNDEEGDDYRDIVDIGIGRLMARSKKEAGDLVNKIKEYHSQAALGDWRNWIAVVGDDEDGMSHMRFTEHIADTLDEYYPRYNVDKIYFDAYPQVSGPGGERYPAAKEAINERMRKGALAMYYIGHGGEVGWAHERVLEVSDINGWTNKFALPFFITATCEFSRFDDPQRTSAGEYVLLNPNGGGIGLLTTTRAVTSGPNYSISRNFTDTAYALLDANYARLGDLTRGTKEKTINHYSRSFSLLGDPAMRLAYPQYHVMTTAIPDTIKALEKVKIKGYVADHQGNKMTGFNGVVYPMLFDKEKEMQTLNNDNQGIFTFSNRKNIVFKGKASVKKGEFEFEFVVPKDISFEFGKGKISYYAENGETDASGSYEDFYIGGISDNPIIDNVGPDVNLYMNNEKFVFGGMTDQNPELYAIVFDSNGINTVGNGIGHDITAILDHNTSESIVLNEYYESDLDSYQSGKIRYPFNELKEGRHTLSLKVWDVVNNPSEATTEFVVANDAKLALDHVLNYPNPFTTNTSFYFEHNKPGLGLDVKIEIFTIAGKLVKSIHGQYASDGYRIGPIAWNGRDEFGDKIGRGVYIYRLTVKTPIGEKTDNFEKLVILN